MNRTLFSKDFMLVVIGQIISLFGNAAIRFALPLYLLNQTGSSVLYGTVTACAFIPTILLSPIGGLIADRVNKRNIMVVLDFATAALILGFSLLLDRMDLIVLLAVTLMLLYGIAGAYQPSVQASIPVLVEQGHFMKANSIINTISSFANLIGPVLGGILYSTYGLRPLLRVCMACFLLSAVMELFIRIPFEKQEKEGNIWNIIKADFSESIRFIRKERPEVGKGLIVVCGINLFLSAMITVGLPYIITEVFDFEAGQANRLYGFAEGALAAGGIAGGICAGIFSEKFSIQKAGRLLIACAAAVFPMGAAVWLNTPGLLNYFLMTACCFFIMVCSTVFSVQMMAFVQAETPRNLVGKVIAVMLAVSMCAQPLGNAMYGVLFQVCRGFEGAVILFAGAASMVLAVRTRKIFQGLKMAGL